MKKKKIRFYDAPRYEVISVEGNIKRVSVVENPAIGVKGVYMSNEESKLNKFKAEESKQMIIGPIMIPDVWILRVDESGMPFYLKFSADSIRSLVEKFNSGDNNRSLNIDHKDDVLDGFIFADWIIEDKDFDKSRMWGFDLPIGTYFAEIKVNDFKKWKELTEGGFYGFSIEANLAKKLVTQFSSEEFSKSFGEEFSYNDSQSIEEFIDSLSEYDMWLLYNDKATNLYHKGCRCVKNDDGTVTKNDDCCDYCRTK